VPFLRVIRDKRGYETTYLMHWYREGSRQRSRILYVFRTPGGVRVGRTSLEPSVLRDIESQHPDIAFDWKAVIDNQQIVESAPEVRRPRKRRGTEEEATGVTAPAPPREPSPHATATHAVPATVQGTTPDEQIAFLAQWYPIVRDRVTQRMKDPVRQAALLALAERLNPATWTDADEIAAGLPHAVDAFERLSRVLARRRRRSRRTPKPPAERATAVPASDTIAAEGQPPPPSSADPPPSDT
jgi:hypothetical protein